MAETYESLAPQSFLQPIAPPSILGLFGFAGATVMVGAYMAKWYGGPDTELILFPFAAVFGGLAQFTAGMWSYKARDGIGTAMHGTWGSFWIAYGIFQFMVADKLIRPPASLQSPEWGFWFLVLAAATWSGAFASLTQNLALACVLFSLAVASTIECVARFDGSTTWQMVAGYIFVISAFFAWYTGTALMVEGAAGKPILPVFKTGRKNSVDSGAGEPGVQRGQ